VQRMCVYPLLFKQALKYAEEGEQQQQFTKAFATVQEIIGQVNEEVRRRQEQRRAADIMLSEVGGEAAALLTAARTLAMECSVEMKAVSGAGPFVDPAWHLRSPYKWYVFSDMVMVCIKNKLRGGYHKKITIPIDEITLGGAKLSSQSFTAASRGDKHLVEIMPSTSMPIGATSMAHASKPCAELPESTIDDTDKPEVFFVRWATRAAVEKAEKAVSNKEVGTLYKCWAVDAKERALIVSKLIALQAESLGKVQSRERAQTAASR